MRAKQCSPEGEWMAAMRAGDFDRAWAINDSDLARRIAERTSKHEGPRHLQHIWRGEPLEGARVLVRCYHGLGDTLQFIRFAGPLRRIAREVIVWAQPELLSLLRNVEGVDRVLRLHDRAPEADYDVDIEIMELGHALRATQPCISQAVPYLRPPQYGSNVGGRTFEAQNFHVGIVWRAGDWDRRRSVDLARFAPLADVPCVRLHLLQPTHVSERPLSFPADDCTSADIADVAATLTGLDLVLTVDTMMAHLAGAMAVPVWTMLCRDCDWRWGTGTNTAWYPTMRLFRQRRVGQWGPVIEEISSELRKIVRERTKERVSMEAVGK
jgi:hypothetical protein